MKNERPRISAMGILTRDRAKRHRGAIGLVVMSLIGWSGCSRSGDDAAGQPYAASEGDTNQASELPPVPNSASDRPANTENRTRPIDDTEWIVTESNPGRTADAPPPVEFPESVPPPEGLPVETGTPVGELPGNESVGEQPERSLPAGLSPDQLVKFLAGADSDMQIIASGRSGIDDPEKARQTLMQIIKLKREAARQLASAPDASAAMVSEGARGELQALSHMAALGDLKSAEMLEELATRNLKSSDPKLASDSRLVLIGFAIEQLQNGRDGAAARIADLVGAMAESAAANDVPAMMVMGQARDMLARYGHDTEAKTVRDTIIDLFADSPDASIAAMAAQVAGNVRYDGIESLREKIAKGDGTPISDLTIDQWREAAETLIDESADLQTVQYLAGAALEFEASDLDVLAKATYDVMTRRFDDPKTATGREVDLAVRARDAREKVIGRKFDPDLPAIDGAPLSMRDYRGKVVLMPFWASGFPESLQVVPILQDLVEANPNQVSIVGMNLDVAGTDLDEVAKDDAIGFPSYRADSSATDEVANPVAVQFGLVSMPFVAILDGEGRVRKLDFTGRQLASTVKELIEESKPKSSDDSSQQTN